MKAFERGNSLGLGLEVLQSKKAVNESAVGIVNESAVLIVNESAVRIVDENAMEIVIESAV